MAFQVFVATLENAARDHITLADTLIREVAEPIKAVEERQTALRKLVRAFYVKAHPWTDMSLVHVGSQQLYYALG